jgi:hypothetical protein
MRNAGKGWLSAIAAVLLVPALVAAQELPPRLPAAASPPPELERLQEAQTRAEQAQKERRALPTVPTPPDVQREMEEVRQRAAPQGAGAQRAPSREELLQRLRDLPGGADRLEQARKRGAPIPGAPGDGDTGSPPTASLLDRALEVLAWLNPFHIESAHAQSPSFSVSLTTPNFSSSSPSAWAFFAGVDVWANAPNSRWVSYTGGSTTAIERPYAYFSVNVPTAGWYIVNFSGWGSNSKASLHHYGGGSGWQPVTGWDYSNRYENLAYPALLELAPGQHYFIFKPTQGGVLLTGIQTYSLQ